MWGLILSPSYSCRLCTATAFIYSVLDVTCFLLWPTVPAERNLPSANIRKLILWESIAWCARSHPKILGVSRSWRSLISTCALLVQLLKHIPVPDTQPWWYLAKQLLFARSCSFLWSQCNYKWMQQRREVQRDWSRKILCSDTPVIRCRDGFGLFWGQRR